MSIVDIIARFSCDGCGARFGVEMDNASTLPDGWTLTELAVDAVRGGPVLCSVQDGMELCAACTAVADSIGEEDHKPTRAEILAALDRKSR